MKLSKIYIKSHYLIPRVLTLLLISLVLVQFQSIKESMACGWHYETIKAEGTSLPCTRNVALNAYPHYQESHLKQKVRASLIMNALLPTSLRALDELAVSSILLKDLPQARCVLERRQELAPDMYATHANWGTYFTFSGEFELAEKHVKATIKSDPEAHFGREKDHLILVQYLKEHQKKKKYPVDMYGRSFKKHLGTLYPVQKESRSELRSQEAALVSMISIYGASDHPLLFATLGITLKQQGNILLAAAAFQKAIRFRHPQRNLFQRWISKAHQRYQERFRRNPKPNRHRRGAFAELTQAIGKAESAANYRVKKYHQWLTARFEAGIFFWDDEGLEEIYQEQTKRKLRCTLADAQPLQYQMPQYPSHHQALKQFAPQLIELLKKVNESKEQIRCEVLQTALNQGLAESASQVSPSDQISETSSPPEEARKTLNEIIKIGLSCPHLEFIPKQLPCISITKRTVPKSSPKKSK